MECKSKISGTQLRHASTYHIKGRSEGFRDQPGPSYHNITALRMTFQCGATNLKRCDEDEYGITMQKVSPENIRIRKQRKVFQYEFTNLP